MLGLRLRVTGLGFGVYSGVYIYIHMLHIRAI